MKGIVLAAGTGSRLGPSTLATTKHLLPVYDKPMIYYPLSILMLAGIRDILLICTSRDLPAMQRLLGDGSAFGVAIAYATQDHPGGIAEAFVVGRPFVAGEPCALVLGDNLFFGGGLHEILHRAAALESGCLLFGYRVARAESFGVLEFAEDGETPRRIVEKPTRPPSRMAVTGLYFYDGEACDRCRALRPSARGELEITDLNNGYLAEGKARVETLGRGIAWLDAGTPDSLMNAAHFVQTIQERQGQFIACLEEIALDSGWIDSEVASVTAERLRASPYGQHLSSLIGS